MKVCLLFLPPQFQERWHHVWPATKRLGVWLFCAFHLLSVAWWLIPSTGYGTDSRIAPAFNWLAKMDEQLISWKQTKAQANAFWIFPLENYSLASTTYQSWRMFAPNPVNVQMWLASYPVIGWRELGPGEALPEGVPWKERRMPVYDAVSVFDGFDGMELAARMDHSPSIYGYGFKVSESVLGLSGVTVLQSIADWSLKKYMKTHAKRPLGFHVLRFIAPIATEFNSALIPRKAIKSSVVFFHHY